MSHAHLACKYPRHCRLEPPLSYASQNTLDRRVNKRMLSSNYGRFWHNPDLQRPLGLGPITATLPTFERECRFTAGNQTQFRAAANAHK